MNISGQTRASIQADMIRNMSKESLMSIAPAVKKLAGRDLSQISSSEDEGILKLIRSAVARYAPTGQPHNPNGVAGQWPQWVTDAQRANRQWVGNSVAPGQSTGNRGSFNLETGEFRTYSSAEEWRASAMSSMRRTDQDMVNQLMDRINALQGNGDMNVSGNGVDETV